VPAAADAGHNDPRGFALAQGARQLAMWDLMIVQRVKTCGNTQMEGVWVSEGAAGS
jgi:hypothetical protein